MRKTKQWNWINLIIFIVVFIVGGFLYSRDFWSLSSAFISVLAIIFGMAFNEWIEDYKYWMFNVEDKLESISADIGELQRSLENAHTLIQKNLSQIDKTIKMKV